MNRVVFNQRGQVRTAWRVLLYAGLFLLGSVASAASLAFLGLGGVGLSAASLPAYVLLCLSALVPGLLIVALVDGHRRRPAAALGVSAHDRVGRESLQGTVVGFLIVLAVWLAMVVTGMVDVSMGAVGPFDLLTVFVVLVLAAAFEELFFRGYLLAVMIDGGGVVTGVVITSASLHERAYEQVFRDVGLDFSDAARGAVRSGKARAHVLDVALPGAKPDLKKRLSDAKPEALKVLLADQSDCSIPGASDAVHALAKENIPMAVVTNSRSPEIWIEKLGISGQIRVVIGGDDVSSPKPSADGYLLGAERLGVAPARCLAIEDSHDGWSAARRAGMSVAIVAEVRPSWLDAKTETMECLDAARILRLLTASSATRP